MAMAMADFAPQRVSPPAQAAIQSQLSRDEALLAQRGKHLTRNGSCPGEGGVIYMFPDSRHLPFRRELGIHSSSGPSNWIPRSSSSRRI